MAAKLGRTVAELRRTISAREFRQWNVYFARQDQMAELAAKMR